jgi:hypothetical protein
MNPETETSKKRKNCDDCPDSPSRLALPSNQQQFLKRQARACFLPCHLKMLQSLYCASGTNVEDPSLQDGEVSEEVWLMVAKFLEHGQGFRDEKLRAHLLRSIVNEANTWKKKRGQQADSCFLKSSPTLASTTRQSPVGRRLLASPSFLPATMTLRAKQETFSSSSFTLVTQLLEREAKVAETNAHRTVGPFHQLYQAACQRTERLDALLRDYQQKQSHDVHRNAGIEAKAKSHLWNMLAADLYDVIQA